MKKMITVALVALVLSGCVEIAHDMSDGRTNPNAVLGNYHDEKVLVCSLAYEGGHSKNLGHPEYYTFYVTEPPPYNDCSNPRYLSVSHSTAIRLKTNRVCTIRVWKAPANQPFRVETTLRGCK